MESGLPNIEIPFMMGVRSIKIDSNLTVSLQEVIATEKDFDEKYRGLLLAYATRIESLIDDLIEIMFFYVLEADVNERSKGIFYNTIINNSAATLNYKITFLMKLIKIAPFEKEKTTVKELEQSIELFTSKLNQYKGYRNLLAHCKVKPHANANTKKIDIWLLHNQKEIKVDEDLIRNIVASFEYVNKILGEYIRNFVPKDEKEGEEGGNTQ